MERVTTTELRPPSLSIPQTMVNGRRAVDLLGDVGVTNLTTLIGYYTTVSLTMAAYDVPADAVGLKR
jgi:hypothetical protein